MSDPAVCGVNPVTLTPEQQASQYFSRKFRMGEERIPPVAGKPAIAVEIERAKAHLISSVQQLPKACHIANWPVAADHARELRAFSYSVPAQTPNPTASRSKNWIRKGLANLGLVPLAISVDEAAALVNLSVVAFRKEVEAGTFPRPISLACTDREIYDPEALKQALHNRRPTEGSCGRQKTDAKRKVANAKL